ncbi:TonB-dependent receptor [Burkholderia glumae]|uniref:TonB-dependent receptor n=1 Tax=Burkholderia glumae TaxID=337 RepID=UPI002037325A|nr:TonB-dependent siderophore receptor [Burkholderia glumae]MCM2494692.1 TonB-dependent siderophore receptor [Burkholderia glumae]MCM2545562.1 TonB-dependent siderophore receptor [Burkholderia glumae]
MRINVLPATPRSAISRACLALLPLAAQCALPADALAQAAPSATAATALPAIAVQGKLEELPGDLSPAYAGGQVARGADYGMLGKQRNIDMPFSMTSYTSKLIEDQQARTLADVLDNDPAVRSGYGYGNFSQVFVIRGFALAGDDVSLNGLYGLTPRQLVATDAVDRVDVLKGANAFLSGASPAGTAVGGDINLQLKRAGDKPLTRVTVDGGTSGELAEHLDVGRRFGSTGQFGIRANQAASSGDTEVDGEHHRSGTQALSLDWRGDRLRLYADLLHQRQRVDNGRPVLFVTGNSVPVPPPATYNDSQRWAYSDLEDTLGMLRAEYDFAPGWTAYAAGGARHTDERGEYYSPTYGANGATTGSRLGVPHKEDAESAEAGVRGHFATGPVTHRVSVGAAYTRLNSQSAYTFSGTFPTSIYHTEQVPYPATIGSGGNLADPGTVSMTWTRSIAVSDTLGFLHDRVLFTLGARRQSIAVSNYAYTGAPGSVYDQSVTTPVFGLVLKPSANLAFYANRSEALTPGSSAPNTAVNFGQALAPYRSKQYEAGTKYDSNRFGAAFALFQIEKPMAYTNPATRVFAADGTERHRGIEASINGEPLKGLRLIAGASYIDATLQDTAGGTSDGKRPIGVPRFTFTANAEYDLPFLAGATLTARWIHTSPAYLDLANTLSIPSWNRFDLGARYRTELFRKPTTLRVMVRNVANQSYWASAVGGYLTQGAPRSIWLSMTTDF